MSHDSLVLVAGASPSGGLAALVRCAGPGLGALVKRWGLVLPPAWTWQAQALPLAGGQLPARVVFQPAPRSFCGDDTLELVVPGSSVVLGALLAHLEQLGASRAGPGAFTRRALANGRLDVEKAEAVLALTSAPDAAAAERSLQRVRGALSEEIHLCYQEILELRARLEAGLDFAEEEDVSFLADHELHQAVAALAGRLRRWRRATIATGVEPEVCLIGASGAGKSALFNALTTSQALLGHGAGTTRDYLIAPWRLPGGRVVRLVDTAGFLEGATHLDQEAVRRGQARLAGASVVLACTAVDAPLPSSLPPDPRWLIVQTKADLGTDMAAALALSVHRGVGLDALAVQVEARLADCAPGEERLQAGLVEALRYLDHMLVADAVAQAECLRRAGQALSGLIAPVLPDDVLNQIFSRFCIGK